MPRNDIRPSRNQLETQDREVYSTAEHLQCLEIPPFPEDFNEAAQFWWTYYCGLMIECGTLSRLFIGSIKNFCKLAAIIEEVEAKVAEQGTFILVPKKFRGEEYDEEVLNPLLKDLGQYYDRFDRLATSLGMTLYSSKINALDATGTGNVEPPTPPGVDLPTPETLPFVGTG